MGYNDWNGTISYCYATGSITGGDNSTHLGGLAGFIGYGSIDNCYATGVITGGNNSYNIGGLVGANSASISNSYTTGSVSGGMDVGGFAGSDYGGSYTTCFWESTVNSDLTGVGNEDPDPAGVIGETTANMQTQSTFVNAGWDFNTPIWKMCDGPDYPKLGWEECPEAATLLDVVSTMLDANSLKNENMKNAFLNKLSAVQAMIDDGRYQAALKKLENDILAKTDGCADANEPDKNDWIKDCEEQRQIYPFIIETIEYVNSLVE